MTADVHLFILIHGLWGRPSHLDAAKDELEAAWLNAHPVASTPPLTPPDSAMHDWPDQGDSETAPLLGQTYHVPAKSKRDDELVIVVAEGMTSHLTYDGIDVCASRVAWEVDQHVARLEADGRRVARFSVMGYSLGGLVARYLIGLLEARTPSFFAVHKPVTFTTIATPHLGIPRYNTLLSTCLTWLGGRLMSRTGEQLHVVDRYSDADPRPLLEIMADPKRVFHQALARFGEVHIYANVVNDNTVPYPSAAIDSADHFVQWVERGLEVEADESSLMTDYHFPAPDTVKIKRRLGFNLGTLPPMLRLRWPLNYLVLALFPILFPLCFLLALLRFSLDTSRSRKRLQRLARAGDEPGDPASPGSPSSPIPSPNGLSIDGLRAAIRAVERNLEADLIDAADAGEYVPPDDDEMLYPRPTVKALLTEQQLRMVHWLGAVEPQRHLAWFPDVQNSHAVIVVRDPGKWPAHERGRCVLRHWAKSVVADAEE